jgi:hypothetical protein
LALSNQDADGEAQHADSSENQSLSLSQQSRNEINTKLPKYCRETCTQCSKKNLKFKSLTSLLAASKDEITNELIQHGHPSSLKMPRHKERSKNQAISHLKDHYKFVHNMKL